MGKAIGMQLRDLASGARQLIFLALYGDDKRLTSFKLSGNFTNSLTSAMARKSVSRLGVPRWVRP